MTDDMEQFGLAPETTSAFSEWSGVAADSRLLKKWNKAKKKKGLGQPLAPEERNPSMIFLLSSPRSGSTLLRAMLAGHPALFSPPELHLLTFYSMKQSKKIFNNSYFGKGLQRAFMELQQISAEESMQHVAALTEQEAPIYKVYRELQTLCAPRTLVDKSPSYSVEMDTLLHAEAIFNQAKYVHLVRHPYAVIESFVRTGLLGGQLLDAHAYIEQVWAQGNANLLEFFAGIAPERKHVLRYEDLVASPEPTTRALCDFLQVPFDEALLKPYEGKRMLEGADPNSLALGDPNFLSHDKIEANLGEAWRRITLDRPLGEAAVRVAKLFGYELPREASL